MHQFSGIVDGREIHLLYEGEDQPCYLGSRVVVADVTRVDETFTNLRQASAVLRSEIGYGPACEVLDSAGVPRTSALWNLNHDGPPSS